MLAIAQVLVLTLCRMSKASFIRYHIICFASTVKAIKSCLTSDFTCYPSFMKKAWQPIHGVAQSRTRLKQLSMQACMRGNPLQYSCLENPTDRGAWGASGAWWATYSPQGCKESDTTEQLTLTPSSSQSSHKIATEMAEPLDPNNNTVTQLTANG